MSYEERWFWQGRYKTDKPGFLRDRGHVNHLTWDHQIDGQPAQMHGLFFFHLTLVGRIKGTRSINVFVHVLFKIN